MTDLMTDITFGAIVRVHQTGGDMVEIFCTNAIMKKLHGKVKISNDDPDDPCYMNSTAEIIEQLSGRLLIYVEGSTFFNFKNRECIKLVAALNRMFYVSQTIKRGSRDIYLLGHISNLLFNYIHYVNKNFHMVY